MKQQKSKIAEILLENGMVWKWFVSQRFMCWKLGSQYGGKTFKSWDLGEDNEVMGAHPHECY
jgi:hypothetical protein